MDDRAMMTDISKILYITRFVWDVNLLATDTETDEEDEQKGLQYFSHRATIIELLFGMNYTGAQLLLRFSKKIHGTNMKKVAGFPLDLGLVMPRIRGRYRRKTARTHGGVR